MSAASSAPYHDTAPLWREAVVGASVAAMAAAAGLGARYEVGAAPWVAIGIGGATALALWGAHRIIGGSPMRRTRPRARDSGLARGAEAPEPGAAPTSARRPQARPPLAETPASIATQPATQPHQPVFPASLPTDLPADLAAYVPGVEPSLPTSDFATPRGETLRHDALPVGEPLQPAPVQDAREIIAPTLGSHEPGRLAQPAQLTPETVGERMAEPGISGLDPEAQFLRLQGLVRQLAAEVPGPRAASVDPDRQALSAHELPPIRQGFDDAPVSSSDVRAAPQPAMATSGTPIARLAEAVAAQRFDVLLEPIQRLAEARVRHFEISVRFRDQSGVMIEPDEVIRIARNTGLSTSIDALKLPSVAKVVQRIQARGGVPSDVLTGLAGASLADHAFMESLAAAFPGGVPGALVLSLPQADVRAFGRVHWSALSALSDMGLRFALDDVSDLDMDFELLRARQFVFAKLEAGIFLDGLPCAGSVVPPGDICRHLEASGIEVVVLGIDSEDQLAAIAPHAVPYGQGKLFGGARPVKAEILN